MNAPRCILCGAPPPLSGEHLWPGWYNRQQPVGNWYVLESTIEGDAAEYVRTDELDLKPEVLCPECNGEWGSNLEQSVSRILLPMTRGEDRVLDRSQMQVVSAWFYLKAMVSEHLVPQDRRLRRFFQPEEGQHLRLNRAPPDGTAIWIGRYTGTRADAGWVMDRGVARHVSDDPPAGVFLHTVTYSIGQVLLQLFAVTRPIPYPEVTHPEQYGPVRTHFAFAPGDWDRCLTSLWQTSRKRISWPPQRSLDDAGFVYLAERWLTDDERGRATKQPLSRCGVRMAPLSPLRRRANLVIGRSPRRLCGNAELAAIVRERRARGVVVSDRGGRSRARGVTVGR